MVLCLVVNLLGGPEEAVSAYRRIGVSAFEVRCSKFEVPSSGCDRSNGAGPSTTEAYASRVDSVMHSRPANPKDYTRTRMLQCRATFGYLLRKQPRTRNFKHRTPTPRPPWRILLPATGSRTPSSRDPLRFHER